jgi:LPXTG-motif cell wall-anchored protein
MPQELPKTGSTLPLVGLFGAIALILSLGLKVMRRRLIKTAPRRVLPQVRPFLLFAQLKPTPGILADLSEGRGGSKTSGNTVP